MFNPEIISSQIGETIYRIEEGEIKPYTIFNIGCDMDGIVRVSCLPTGSKNYFSEGEFLIQVNNKEWFADEKKAKEALSND